MKDKDEKKQINVFLTPARAVEMMDAIGTNTAGAAVCACATIGLNALRAARLTRAEALAAAEMSDEDKAADEASGKTQEAR
jgi:Zn-dependent alcohol dehydrogenase